MTLENISTDDLMAELNRRGVQLVEKHSCNTCRHIYCIFRKEGRYCDDWE